MTKTMEKYEEFRKLKIPKKVREECHNRAFCERIGNITYLNKCRGCFTLFNLWLDDKIFIRDSKEKVSFT